MSWNSKGMCLSFLINTSAYNEVYRMRIGISYKIKKIFTQFRPGLFQVRDDPKNQAQAYFLDNRWIYKSIKYCSSIYLFCNDQRLTSETSFVQSKRFVIYIEQNFKLITRINVFSGTVHYCKPGLGLPVLCCDNCCFSSSESQYNSSETGDESQSYHSRCKIYPRYRSWKIVKNRKWAHFSNYT